jgi:hypothetical protein
MQLPDRLLHPCGHGGLVCRQLGTQVSDLLVPHLSIHLQDSAVILYSFTALSFKARDIKTFGHVNLPSAHLPGLSCRCYNAVPQ